MCRSGGVLGLQVPAVRPCRGSAALPVAARARKQLGTGQHDQRDVADEAGAVATLALRAGLVHAATGTDEERVRPRVSAGPSAVTE